MMDKQEMRARMLARRRLVGAQEQVAASAAVCARVLEWLAERPDGVVLSYLAYGREIDLEALHRELWRQGRRLAVPKTAGLAPGEMVAVEYAAGARLAKVALGVREPEGAQEVRPEEIGVVIAPGVAFDRAGNRLGHGMGYYDRYLAGLKDVAVVGVAYDWQVVEAVPVAEFDRAMDKVLTDKREI